MSSAIRRTIARRLTPRQKALILKAKRKFKGEKRSRVAARGKRQRFNISAPYSAERQREADLDALKDALTRAGIEFMELPHIERLYRTLVVKDSDRDLLRQLVRGMGEDWEVTAYCQSGRTVHRTRSTDKSANLVKYEFCRPRVVASNFELTTSTERITVEIWRTLGEGEQREDGSEYETGTLRRSIIRRTKNGPYVEYLAPHVWQAAKDKNKPELPWPHPHLYEITDPIDIVFTWVDGDDPEWRARKDKASGRIVMEEVNETALSYSRFANRDELKYALRSVEYYADWINRIYIVTDSQVPSWLKKDHPKVQVIDHKEIFTDEKNLPVFNSHAIESQLHHIPGLSEKYLYSNDDFFFMRPTSPQLFFTGNGLSKFFPSNAPLDIHEVSPRDLPVLSAAKQGRSFMETVHGRTVSNKFKHVPQPQLKSVLEQMESDHPEVFEKTAASKFRHPEDYSIPSALYHYHAFALGKSVVGNISYGYVDINMPDFELRLEQLWHRNLDVMCINDTDLDEADNAAKTEILSDFFERRFPVKSSFEL